MCQSWPYLVLGVFLARFACCPNTFSARPLQSSVNQGSRSYLMCVRYAILHPTHSRNNFTHRRNLGKRLEVELPSMSGSWASPTCIPRASCQQHVPLTQTWSNPSVTSQQFLAASTEVEARCAHDSSGTGGRIHVLQRIMRANASK